MALPLAIVVQILAIVVLLYLPGRLVLHFLGGPLASLEKVVVSSFLGALQTCVVYWICAASGHRPLFWAWPIGITLLYLGLVAHRPDRLDTPVRLRPGTKVALLGVFLSGVTVLALFPLYFENLTWKPDGGMHAHAVTDAYLHIAIATELTHTVPPQDPMAAGTPLSYHVGNDLLVSVLASVTGASVRDLTVRFVPPLLLGLSMLAVFCFARRWLASEGWAVLVTALVFFGEDFSFVPRLLGGDSIWWTVMSAHPSVFSLFWFNPMLPGLGLLFCGLLCLQLYLDEKRLGWLVISAVLFASLAEVKIFTAAQLDLSLGFAAVVFAVRLGDRRLLQVAALTALLTIPLVLAVAAQNRSGAGIAVTLGGWRAIARLGAELPQRGLPNLGDWYLLILVPLVVVVTLGVRVIGARVIGRALLRPDQAGAMRFLLAVFVIFGVLLSLTVRILPVGHPDGYDNGAWFFGQSKYVAWLFAVEVMRAWAGRLVVRGWSTGLAGGAVAGLALGCSLPATVHFFRNETRYFRSVASTDFSPAQTEIATALAGAANPGDVVMCTEEMLHPVLTLTSCRTLLGDFSEYMVQKTVVDQRKRLLQDFWANWARGECRSDIMNTLRVRFVVGPGVAGPGLGPTGGGLVALHANAGYTLYEFKTLGH